MQWPVQSWRTPTTWPTTTAGRASGSRSGRDPQRLGAALSDRPISALNLHKARLTRELIGQAQGILMERERITGPQAFDVLRRASQHLNIIVDPHAPYPSPHVPV